MTEPTGATVLWERCTERNRDANTTGYTPLVNAVSKLADQDESTEKVGRAS